MMAIYKITNIITQDFYIGSAIRYDYRRWSHLHTFRKNKHKNPKMQNSYNKYGEDAFIFEVILIAREQYWMDKLLPNFNILKIAGSPLGVKHTEKAKENMSKAHIGLTTEQRGHKSDCICPICNRKDGIESPRYVKREERFCECGCGISYECRINSKKRFISGHNNVGENSVRYKQRDVRTCMCGCNKTYECKKDSKRRYVHGHNKPQLGRVKSIEEVEKRKKTMNERYLNKNNINLK